MSAGNQAVNREIMTLTLHPEEVLLLFPDDTKTGGRDGPMEAHFLGTSLCCFLWLQKYLAAHHAQGPGPFQLTNYLIRPQNAAGMHVPIIMPRQVNAE